MNKQHLTLFGLKFHPFRPGVPLEALMALPAVDSFCRRVEFSMGDGGWAALQRASAAHPKAAVPPTLTRPNSHVAPWITKPADDLISWALLK